LKNLIFSCHFRNVSSVNGIFKNAFTKSMYLYPRVSRFAMNRHQNSYYALTVSHVTFSRVSLNS
jgi:hypothetical protein